MLILREPHRNLEIAHGAEGWRAFLAHPPRHWRDNRAARRLAEAWEVSAPNPPAPVSRALGGTPFESFEAVVAIPAYEVEMPGGWHPAQTDLFVVGWVGEELAVLTVHGKVLSSLGPHLDEWLHNPSPGKLRRIGFLKRTLELPDPIPESLCRGLLHSAAAPLLEARRLGATRAAMVVVAFGPSEDAFHEYQDFSRLLGAAGARGQMERSPRHDDPELWVGWVDVAAEEARGP